LVTGVPGLAGVVVSGAGMVTLGVVPVAGAFEDDPPPQAVKASSAGKTRSIAFMFFSLLGEMTNGPVAVASGPLRKQY